LPMKSGTHVRVRAIDGLVLDVHAGPERSNGV